MGSNKEAKLFKSLFVEAARNALSGNRQLLDDLNVFPVPDGDTGINMLLTVKGMADHAPIASMSSDAELKDVAKDAYDACLLSARGNSGLLLSFLFKGLNEAIQDTGALTGEVLAKALSDAAVTAKAAIPNPKEGTMITVLREAGARAQKSAAQDNGLAHVLSVAADAADAAVKETPSQLKALRDAKVVDSGGLGIAVVLRGALNKLNGDGDGSITVDIEQFGVDRNVKVDDTYLAAVEEEAWGYCTVFVIMGDDIPIDEVKEYLQENGRSSLAVGTGKSLKVHVHSQDPGNILSFAVRYGGLSNIDINNMELQAANWAKERRNAAHDDATAQTPPPDREVETGIVAVANGEGMHKLFKHFAPDAVTIVDGGQKMNPDVNAILNSIKANPAHNVLVLPNSKDVIGTAGVAAELCTDKEVKVVPVKSMPAGLAIMVEFNVSEALEHNLKELTAALPEINYGSVARAAYDATVDGINLKANDYVASVNGKVVLTSGNAEEALVKTLQTAADPNAACFIYYGGGIDPSQAKTAAAMIEKALPELEQVDLIFGGQAHHQYLFAVEA